ncbi:unnamed protein product, partial [Auanema sp. JU1783]
MLDKFEGASVGIICDVYYSGMSHRYFVKCRQTGWRSSSMSIENGNITVNPPFIQEMFIYKLFSLINVGGEVHFPLPMTPESKKPLYIATRNVTFTLAKELTRATINYETISLVYFLQFILSLGDVLTNGANYGHTIEGHPVIVDFCIIPKDDYLLTDEQISTFWNEKVHCTSQFISEGLQNIPKERKEEIIRKAIQEWKLFEALDQAKIYVEQFVAENEHRLEVSGDLNGYVKDIQTNIN